MLRCLLLVFFPVLLLGQSPEIRQILNESENAWNRGDLATFVSYYEDSPETTFVGREVTRGGPKEILERYRRSYPTREAMGKLSFSEIEVRQLADGVALAIGRFHLQRSAAGGGDASGRFTLILRRTAAGWKIIHDHSS